MTCYRKFLKVFNRSPIPPTNAATKKEKKGNNLGVEGPGKDPKREKRTKVKQRQGHVPAKECKF